MQHPTPLSQPEIRMIGHRCLGGAGERCRQSNQPALSVINSSTTHHLPTQYQLLCRYPSRRELGEEA